MKFAHNNLAHVVALVGSLAATVPAAAAAAAGANSNVSRDLCKSAKERHLQITTEAPLVQPSPTVMTPAPTVPPTSVVFAGVQKYVGAAGADRGVEGEVKASLEEDDQVTVMSSVDVGALVCDTLPTAVNADTLLFRATDESVTATRISFTTVDGAILPDSETRHVWQGVVTVPEIGPDQAEASSVSMSWGVDCNVETFLWKMTTRMLDGTTKVLKSIPCEVGDITDMCLVEVSLHFLEESEALEEDGVIGNSTSLSPTPAPTGISSRRLKGMTESSAGLSTGRNLQEGITVTVAMFYTLEALVQAGNISPEQMVTTILEGLTTSNLACENSGINMEFDVVYVGLLPYEQARGTPSALGQLRDSEEVNDIRNLYEADLVQLVGAFTDSCGRGYHYLENDPLTGFSLVSPNCIDGYSHTHEFGHNLGCRHNRENSHPETEYSHGLRYCDVPDEEKFRTIMAYDCPTTQRTAPRLNYFSTPTIDYLGRPMGTATENNALTITDNMAAVSGWRGKKAVNGTEPPALSSTVQTISTLPPTPPPLSVRIDNVDPGWSHEGCYADDEDRVLTGFSFKGDPDMTIEKCAGLCEGSAYFGVQSSHECFCSVPEDDPFELGPATCVMPCSGDADQICGGSYAMSIYKYGDAFDFLGCFGDSVHARVLSGAFKNDSAMTTKMCAAFCGSAPFFGIEYGEECFCGVESDDPEELGTAICNFECAGDADKICGGKNAISVYMTGDIIEMTSPTNLGCWSDLRSDRLMTLGDSHNTVTTKICEDICRGQTYFGTQYGKECWCGDADTDYRKHGQSTACTMACAGGGGDICGGNTAMTVYEY